MSQIPNYIRVTPSSIKAIGPYKVYGKIGSGSFGIILLAKKKSPTKTKFVVLKIALRSTSKQKKETEDEIRFFYHPKYKKNCKKFYCLKETFSVIDGEIRKKVIVLDLLDGVHLHNLLRSQTMESRKITWDLDTRKKKIQFINTLVKSIIKNLQDFHKLGLSHGDLHLGNIMYIPEQKRAVVVDFGMSCQKSNNIYYAACNSGFLTGNKYYQTPKKLNSNPEMYRTFNSLKTHQSDDVFALNNILIRDIINESFIFKDLHNSQIPILRKWEKAFPLDILVDDNKRIKAFKKFQII